MFIVVIVADAVVVGVSVVAFVVELSRLGARRGERLVAAFIVCMKPPVGKCAESSPNCEASRLITKEEVGFEWRKGCGV